MAEVKEQVLNERLKVSTELRSLPMAKRMVKVYMDVLSKIAPAAAGRRAADIFGYTRTFSKKRLKDISPLGARAFPIQGTSGVTKGYQWGKPGKTVLLVHGWGSDSSTMFSFVRSFVDAGFRVAVFDAPAHGVSPGHITTMMQFNNAVRDVIVSLGDVVAVVAHSIGGITTVGAIRELAGYHQIKAVCLIASPANLPLVIKRWSSDFLKLTDNVISQMCAELWRRNGVPVQHWDVATLSKEMQQIRMIVMHDPADPVIPVRDAEIIAESLSQVTLEKVPGAGQHLRILSNPRVIERVCRFVTEHTRTSVSVEAKTI